MMQHLDAERAFIHSTAAWYATARDRVPRGGRVDEVMFGLYCDGGGTRGEMAVRWFDLGGEATPRLEVFSDAMEVLGGFADVVQWFACNPRDFTPSEFMEALKALGFRDITKRVRPVEHADISSEATREEVLRLRSVIDRASSHLLDGSRTEALAVLRSTP